MSSADNLQITQGSGTTVRTEEIGGVHFPIAKFAVGKEGSLAMLGHLEDDPSTSGDGGLLMLAVRRATAIDSVSTDGDYAALQIDDEGRQWVRPAPVQVRLQVTPAIFTGSPQVAYTSGDVLGNLQTLTGAARKSGGSGIIQSITVLDKTQAQRAAIDLLFFNQSITLQTDNDPATISDSDMANCLGVVSIGPYNTAWAGTPLNSISTLLNVGLPFVCSGSANLFAAAIVRGTPTYGTISDLIFSYTILQD